jgi:hypothetical protein
MACSGAALAKNSQYSEWNKIIPKDTPTDGTIKPVTLQRNTQLLPRREVQGI